MAFHTSYWILRNLFYLEIYLDNLVIILFRSSPEQASMETTYTMVSKQSSNSFSLPIAAPREKLSSKLKRRVSLQSQPTMKVDTLKYQHLLLPAPVQTPQTKRLGKI